MEIFSAMKQTAKRTVKVVAFLLVLALLTGLAEGVLTNGTDNHKYLFRDFYDAPAAEVDVVYMGGSSAGWNWNPTVAYRAQGLGSQLLASERNPPDSLPYLLKEAAKKSPKLYIVDAQRLLGRFGNDLAAVQSILINMKPSANRLDAADDMLEDYSQEEKLMKWSPLLFFHSRWKELRKGDFRPVDYDFMGFSVQKIFGDRMPYGPQFLDAEPEELNEKQLENLNEVLRVCAGLEGKVLFMEVPNDGDLAGGQRYVENAVKAAGFDYLNACEYVDEIGLEPGDFQSGYHLTVYGAEKYTAWLSGVIAQRYGLPDHRGEAGYQEAARYEEEYEAYLESKVRRGFLLWKYIEVMADPRYCVLMAVRGEASTGLNWYTITKLEKLGLEKSLVGQYQSSYLAASDGGTILLEEITPPESPQPLEAAGTLADGTSFRLKSAGAAAGDYASIVVGGVEYAVNGRGLNIVVYDNQTHRVIDSVAFDTFQNTTSASRLAEP